MVKTEGRTTKAMRPMFGPYVVKQQQGQGYILANKDGTTPSTFKGQLVRVELLRLVHRATEPSLANEMWQEQGSAFRHIIRHRQNDHTGVMEYLVQWKEGNPT
ncbi:hypothetical protein SARC_09291 [Sphaeroforma arctica JP610]|uniref:Chromo domain-containing protein n=1 Tax=Sphaeroforma arctica JP610 TaxID=667725 RepID=A0A0L0FNB1_9EUKA|nr:hypothetical protein SARC_09291 [Sphaeroforma arctica JP610]KNC78272.1 hypothetical protein SARC_09291 [Sphaeroforma arctica JP610]|eukprot:XP_014152174.1 hypothetical protein SARC_09291 [Sphaeroforma arctica JP610]